MEQLSIWYLVFPFLALVTVLPVVLNLPPVTWPENLNTFQFIIAAPFWLGMVAAPGYVYTWCGHHSRAVLPTRQRLWVCSSLVAALIAR